MGLLDLIFGKKKDVKSSMAHALIQLRHKGMSMVAVVIV